MARTGNTGEILRPESKPSFRPIAAMNGPFDTWEVHTGEKPILVLADMHHGPWLSKVELERPAIAAAIKKCGAALTHARRVGFPVALVRRVNTSGLFGEPKRYPQWLKGFAPHRSDMIFEHVLPSCYSSPEFATMAKHSGGNLVLGGFFAETTCLATAVDGYHRGQVVTFLEDASAIKSGGKLGEEVMYRAFTQIASLYSDVTNTQTWIHTAAVNGGIKNGT